MWSGNTLGEKGELERDGIKMADAKNTYPGVKGRAQER
jgi:hypothetical protein